MVDKVAHLRFDEGMPTRPDVDLLLATWPDPQVGDRFDYEAVGKLIGSGWRESRFRTVTTAWRRRLFERGIVVESAPAVSFYVASADQITASTYGTLKFVGKKAHRQRRKLAVAKCENGAQRAVVEHHGRILLAVEKDSKKHRMNLLPSTAAPVPVVAIPDKAKQA